MELEIVHLPGRSGSDWSGSLGKQQATDEASHLECIDCTQSLKEIIAVLSSLPPRTAS